MTRMLQAALLVWLILAPGGADGPAPALAGDGRAGGTAAGPSEGATARRADMAPWGAGAACAVIVFLGVSFIWNRRLVREIKRRKRVEADMEAAVRRAEAANQAKSLFLAGMSHELRTPLNAILGFSRIIARAPALGAEQRDQMNIITRSGEHLLQLINDLLEMSKIESGKVALTLRWFHFRRFLDNLGEMMRFQAAEKNLFFKMDCGPDLPAYIRTDDRRLRQALINLLGNAVKFTEKGGVTFNVTVAEEAGSAARRICFEVRDTGVGVAPEDAASLFAPFHRGASSEQARNGVGLGLSISRGLVRLMGGDIRVESRVGDGARFAFDISVEASDARTHASDPPAEGNVKIAPGQPDYRILIVEDEVMNGVLLKTLMESAGFQVNVAKNGREALDFFDRWTPDFIWMDMNMPVMDGAEAVRRIRSTPKGEAVPIIALTGALFEAEKENALAAGCDAIVGKPFRETELFDALSRFLGVRCIREDPPEAADRDDAQSPEDVDDAFSGLPAQWRAEFRRTVMTAREADVTALIRRIQDDHPRLAATLSAWVREYRYDRLIALAGGPDHAQ